MDIRLPDSKTARQPDSRQPCSGREAGPDVALQPDRRADSGGGWSAIHRSCNVTAIHLPAARTVGQPRSTSRLSAGELVHFSKSKWRRFEQCRLPSLSRDVTDADDPSCGCGAGYPTVLPRQRAVAPACLARSSPAPARPAMTSPRLSDIPSWTLRPLGWALCQATQPGYFLMICR